MNSFLRRLTELRRRRVFGAAAAYLVAAWVTVEIASTLFPILNIPEAALRWVVAAVAVFFLPTMVAAWAYQWTPSGLVRDRGEAAESDDATATAAAAAAAAEPGPGSPNGARAERPIVPNRVAVLPLEALEPNAEAALHLADGLTEEITAGLARTRTLEVVGRTSAARAGAAPTLDGIRTDLRAAYALRGTVRRSSTRVRILAHLLDTRTGANVWSEAFDRALDDALTLEAEIAIEVVRALAEQVPTAAGTAALPARPPAGFEVYDRYLRGRYLCGRRTTEGIRAAVETFREATELDPGFAQAWAGLADAHLLTAKYDLVAPSVAFPEADAAAQRALKEDRSLAEPHATLGSIRALADGDWRAADSHFERALTRNPSYTTALQWRAVDVLIPLGRFEEAEAALARARELDPISPVSWVSGALPSFFNRRFERAVSFCDRALELDPDLPLAHSFRAQSLAFLGRTGEALAAATLAVERSGGVPETVMALGFVRARAGDEPGARECVDRLVRVRAERYVSPDLIAYILAALNDHAGAAEWLALAREVRAYRLVYLPVDPRLDGVRDLVAEASRG